MADKSPDKITALRAKYFSTIKQREDEIRLVREKRKVLDEIEADVAKLGQSDSLPGKYSDSKLTKAILDAIQDIGRNGGVPATDVRNYIAANGYRHPKPKNYPVATVIA